MFTDYEIVEYYFINRLVGEEGDRSFALQNYYAGRRFVKSRINSGFCSSPTASEPYGPKFLLVSIIENTEHEALYFLWWARRDLNPHDLAITRF